MSLFQNFAAEATADAKANQNKSRKPRQNPLTPGQTNSGQDAGLMGTPPDDAQQGQNMPGFATGQKGPTDAPTGTGGMLSGSVGGGLGGPLDRAAAATANQKAGGAPPPAPPPGAPGGGLGGPGAAATGQGSAVDLTKDQGNRGATGPQQLGDGTLGRMSDVWRWNEATKGEPVDVSMYPTKGVQPVGGIGGMEGPAQNGAMGGIPGDVLAGQNDNGIINQDFVENAKAETERQNAAEEAARLAKEREAQTEGMTPAQAALWDRLYGSDQMSDTEKAALSAQALADKNRNKEIIDRIAGGAGGSSAQQIMGTASNEFGYGQQLGDIEKEKYARQFAETQAAAGLAESAASRTERQADAFDKAQQYFGDKGYTVTAEGQLIGADGKPVDTKTLTGADRETYERFMYEMGAENPQNRKEVAEQEQAKQDAFTASAKASAEYNAAVKAHETEKAKLDELKKRRADSMDYKERNRLDGEITTQQGMVNTLGDSVVATKKKADEAAKASNMGPG